MGKMPTWWLPPGGAYDKLQEVYFWVVDMFYFLIEEEAM